MAQKDKKRVPGKPGHWVVQTTDGDPLLTRKTWEQRPGNENLSQRAAQINTALGQE